ncbi:2-oxoglutarate ferredoxin oxidoreductase subunit alpha [Methanomicrobium sp. W14]|uniref:2-oxoacid:acceptor oxidoreductase subunit alpha n=1 Tax=Methanomicrobium sp. W14 TaxID=2817839 RepID=UPI001AE18BA4|nr:2-oxoacid:acceptor oxidoreductase subunit alpha [Methanomicrobium sp. W14]MBP2133211.1 2-oxoglutarate ferredoxin oxidoreductase subunit alpha [Methanomicrobium sp. W14]
MSRIEFMQGNIACAEGALAAGCTFYGGYPITPSTEIAEHMAKMMPKLGRTFIQMEDELASISSVIGASWTGAKAMTATSGPGFSLMMENLGYAVMTETPCVIVDIQRGGPSTGQPTMSAQGDMMQCRFGSHGDYSIIALTPSTVQEMFELTVKAFNLAERFRCPVFLMSDETIGHMRERIIIPDSVETFSRKPAEKGRLPFEPDSDLVPGFPVFGEGHRVHVTGLTHNTKGYPETTSHETQSSLVKRLSEKIESKRYEIADYDLVNPGAGIVFLTYGPATRTVRQVIKDRSDLVIGHINLRMVWPFPERVLSEFKSARVFIVPEMNLGQISREVERHTNVAVKSLPKLGGEMHTPKELTEAMEEYL